MLALYEEVEIVVPNFDLNGSMLPFVTDCMETWALSEHPSLSDHRSPTEFVHDHNFPCCLLLCCQWKHYPMLFCIPPLLYFHAILIGTLVKARPISLAIMSSHIVFMGSLLPSTRLPLHGSWHTHGR